MARPPPPLTRKSSAPWERLRPVKQDPLESMGFVSKGDDRLLDLKTQESFYHKIVARYMQFCSRHAKDLDAAFASLSVNNELSESSDLNRIPRLRPLEPGHIRSLSPSSSIGDTQSGRLATPPGPAPEDELSTILTALRKLREGLLASSTATKSPIFSQRVHVFNIRVAILAMHPPSYHPSLLHLLSVLHTRDHPLPISELSEMTTYLILDLALRRSDLIAAYTVKFNSRQKYGYSDRNVDAILKAMTTNNWVVFWQTRRKVDGYVRAIMQWYIESLRKTTLKAFGRAYLKTDLNWVLQSATGSEMSWEILVEKENVGWIRDGNTITIRKPKVK